MLKKVSIENFKSIDKITINLKQYNLLCGENASGKTSFIHAILATFQSNEDSKSFDGRMIKIGGLAELKNRQLSGDVTISIEDDRGNSRKVILKRNEDIIQDSKDLLVIEANEQRLELGFEKDLFYLSSVRNGVMEIYSKGDCSFGVDGSSSIGYLFEHQDDAMNASYMKAFKEKYSESVCADNPKFSEHVRFWLNKITGEEVNIDSVPYTNQYVLTFGHDKNIRPINTGSGYSFILPIIITCLGAIKISNNPTIIIENPEIYLHPIAQINLVDFLEFISQYAQFIIETHSEYILKRSMEIVDGNDMRQILVFRQDKGMTRNDILDNTNFKISPIAYPEVLYRAFNICSIELHIILFSKLQEKSGATNLVTFDKWILENYPHVPQKSREYNGKSTNTLPIYIRNTVHHPDGKDSTTGKPYIYTQEELIQSVKFMLDVL
ncbi:MAG: AAA family ATPase [Clostridiales bacterium]|nr:AAA family ATPase [Clostridiales bacterium]